MRIRSLYYMLCHPEKNFSNAEMIIGVANWYIGYKITFLLRPQRKYVWRIKDDV